jgi:hypothetical protein
MPLVYSFKLKTKQNSSAGRTSLADEFSFLVTLPNERAQGYDKLSRFLLR